jgi:hypothetical protein
MIKQSWNQSALAKMAGAGQEISTLALNVLLNRAFNRLVSDYKQSLYGLSEADMVKAFVERMRFLYEGNFDVDIGSSSDTYAHDFLVEKSILKKLGEI